MTEATTTLTRAGAHPESLAWWDTYDEFQSSPPEFGGRIRKTDLTPLRGRDVSILAPRIRGAHQPPAAPA